MEVLLTYVLWIAGVFSAAAQPVERAEWENLQGNTPNLKRDEAQIKNLAGHERAMEALGGVYRQGSLDYFIPPGKEYTYSNNYTRISNDNGGEQRSWNDYKMYLHNLNDTRVKRQIHNHLEKPYRSSVYVSQGDESELDSSDDDSIDSDDEYSSPEYDEDSSSSDSDSSSDDDYTSSEDQDEDLFDDDYDGVTTPRKRQILIQPYLEYYYEYPDHYDYKYPPYPDNYESNEYDIYRDSPIEPDVQVIII